MIFHLSHHFHAPLRDTATTGQGDGANTFLIGAIGV
jgi:hypothetical protein